MSSPLYIKISDKDNVAIAVNDIPGREISDIKMLWTASARGRTFRRPIR